MLPAALDRAQLLQNEQGRIEARCAQIETRSGWTDVPFVAFHAVPSQPIPRPIDFYAEGDLRTAVERPEVLRHAGFHIRTEADAEVQADGSIAAATRRRSLWLSPDGHLSAAGSADADFLGWYFNSGNQRPIAINPRVLTEFTLEFARFFHRRLRPAYRPLVSVGITGGIRQGWWSRTGSGHRSRRRHRSVLARHALGTACAATSDSSRAAGIDRCCGHRCISNAGRVLCALRSSPQ